MKVAGRIVTGVHQPSAKLRQIVIDIGIIDVAWFAQSNLVHDAIADPALHLRRQLSTRRFAEVGQIVGLRASRQREANAHDEKERAGTAPFQWARAIHDCPGYTKDMRL